MEASVNADNILCVSSNSVPQGIRLTVTGDPSNSIVVSWFTEARATDAKVKYSTRSDLSSSQESVPIYTQLDGYYVYKAELSDLKSNKTYFFRVYSDSSTKSKTMNFTTAQERDAKTLTFLVWGDSRSNPEARKALSKDLIELFPDIAFTIHTGDVVSDGLIQSEWNEYFEDTEIVNGYKQGYFIEGNHERGFATKMYDNIPLPSNGGNSRYYSFVWGSVGFVGLNTNNQEIWPHEKMPVFWLDRELYKYEQDKFTLWKIAFMHAPFFNSMEGRSDLTDVIPAWCPLFEKYNLDLVFAGHNHYYERSYPMNCKKEFDDSRETHFTNPKYPIYYITGGAAAPLYDRAEGEADYKAPEYVAAYNSTYHFIVIKISVNDAKKETNIIAEAWGMAKVDDEYGGVFLFDNISITKDLPEKYFDSDYETPEITSYVRMPEFLYFILYFGVLAAFILVFEKPILRRYFSYKLPYLKQKRESKRKEVEGRNRRVNIKKLFMVVIFAFLAITLSTVAIFFDLLSEEIAIALAIGLSILIMTPINYLLLGKPEALKTLSFFVIYLALAGVIEIVLTTNNFLFYNFYLDLLLIGVGASLLYLGNYFSNNIRCSKISQRNSFYFGGTTTIFGTFLTFYGVMYLIAMF